MTADGELRWVGACELHLPGLSGRVLPMVSLRLTPVTLLATVGETRFDARKAQFSIIACHYECQVIDY